MARDLEPFRAYLGEFGLSPDTITMYARDVDKALAAGVRERLLGDDLAPKTKRHVRAALRHWAKFTDDKRLIAQLERMKLPAARRVTAKVPLEVQQLFDLLDELERQDYLTRPMAAVISLMALRGFRCGDVLRLRREELAAAKESGVLNYVAKGDRRLEFKVLKTFKKPLMLLLAQPGEWERVRDLIAPESRAPSRQRAAAMAVGRALTGLGVKIGIFGLHPHRLRRTYAVVYLRAMQGDAEALMKLTQHMQWASMATAMEYVDHARGSELDAVAETMFDRARYERAPATDD